MAATCAAAPALAASPSAFSRRRQVSPSDPLI